ncbi:MAG: hypothetical protein P4L16_07655 [Chlamydiales bacterium]|nr:hypothetical protein [Chlamydiales bacterium]
MTIQQDYIRFTNDVSWTETETINKLRNLSQVNGKNQWICAHLETQDSSLIQKIIWFVVKHFQWMRSLFFDINLKESQEMLQDLVHQATIKNNPLLIELLYKAIGNFNAIAPRHQVIWSKEQMHQAKKSAYQAIMSVQPTSITIKVNEQSIKSFSNNMNRQCHLNIETCYLPDFNEKATAAALEKVTSLEIIFSPTITDNDLVNLPPHIEELILYDLPSVTEVPLLPSGLTRLYISTLNVDSLPVLPSTIKTLRIDHLPIKSFNLSEKLITLELAALPNLDINALLSSLACSRHLKHLDLRIINITNAALAKLPQLSSLTLAYMPQICDLSALPNSIQTLTLDSLENVTNETLASIPKTVQHLELNGLPKITDLSSVFHIKEVKCSDLPNVMNQSSLPSNITYEDKGAPSIGATGLDNNKST